MSYAVSLNDIWRFMDNFMVRHILIPFLSHDRAQISKMKYDVGILFKQDVDEKQIKSMMDILQNGTSGRFKGLGKNEVRFYRIENGKVAQL